MPRFPSINAQRKSHKPYSIFLLVALGGFLNSAQAQSYHQIIEAVHLNQHDIKQVGFFLQDENGDLYIEEEDLKAWNIVSPNSQPITYFGRNYHPLYMFNGATFKIDHRRGALHLSVPASFMQKNLIEAGRRSDLHPTKSDLGGFLNYKVFGQTSHNGQSTYHRFHQQHFGGYFTQGIFTKYGALSNDLVAQLDNTNDPSHRKNQVTRINTYWQTDFPSSMKTLRLGDSYSVSGMWGRSISFGGVKWGTNFATQPIFLTFPTLSTRGETAVPTTVELMVNNSLASSSEVNAGPFTIDNIPTISGAGNVNIVTTDILGRQQIVNIPYYTSTQLLKKGLHNYSVEMGAVRHEHYHTIGNNNYGDFMVTGTDLFGVTDNFTSEIHAELLTKKQAVGAGGYYLLGKIGVINAAAAASNSSLGVGGLAQIGFQRQSMSGIGFGFNTIITSKDFMQASYSKKYLPPSLQNQIFFSFPIKTASLGITYTQQNNRDADNFNILSLNYNQSIFRDILLSINAYADVHPIKKDDARRNRAIMVSLTKALDSRTVASIRGNGQTGRHNDGELQITRSLPTDTGYGYDLSVAQGERTRYRGTLMGQTSVGTYGAKLEHQNHTTNAELEASGGIVALGGDLFLTRFINSGNSFAVVDVAGIPNVTVSDNNNPRTKTNRNGKAVITDLLPYQENKIEIQPNDMPLNTTISTTKILLSPYSNSGVVVKFPVKVDHPLMLTLINKDDGKVVPLGATAVLTESKDKSEYIVANDGEVYIPNMGKSDTLLVKWDDTQCVAKINYPKTKDPMPNLGKIECR